MARLPMFPGRIKNIVSLLNTVKEGGFEARIILKEDMTVDFNESRLIIHDRGQRCIAQTISESTLFPDSYSSEVNPLKGIEIIEGK